MKKENWNSFLLQNKASFLQSFEWGEFQEKLARKVWHLAVEQESNIILQALVVKKPLPFSKSYLYIPFGPCFKQSLTKEQKKQSLDFLVLELRKISQQENAVYCYLEPWSGLSQVRGSLPQKRIQPQKTLLINLQQSQEEIFRSLKSKTTRYNIRFAQKKGVEFVPVETIGHKEIDIFYNLAQKSSQRDGFINYDKNYFKKLFSISSQEMPIKLFLAKHNSNYIAANIFIFFGKKAVHLFGGFDHSFRKLMAPYFMHYQQMLFAKNTMLCDFYDFWGIDEKKWPGVTHFKKSFGGEELTYPTGADIVFNKTWYSLFKFLRKLKNIV